MRLVPRGRFIVALAAALLLSGPGWAPWLDPRLDLWHVDDSSNHMIRLYHVRFLIERGVWYPRWVPDMFMGYGYPLLNFYAPGFYYVAWGLGTLLRLDEWEQFRAGGTVAVLAGASGAFTLVYVLWRRALPAILAALILVYQPYVFQINLFRRGDLPEALALALVCWLLLGILGQWRATTRGAQTGWFAATTLCAAALLLTHNLTALIGASLAGAWVVGLLWARPRWERLARVAAAGLVALALTAFFWLPAVGEGRLVHLDELWGTGGLDWRGWMVEPTGYTDKDHKPGNRQTPYGWIDRNLQYPHQLIATPKISLAQVALALLSGGALLGAVAQRVRGSRHRAVHHDLPREPYRLGVGRTADVFTGHGPLAVLVPLGLACWYLTFTVATPFWEHVPGLALFQFPWRMLGPIGIALAVTAPGALVLLTGGAARRWGRRGMALGTGATLLAGAVLVGNSVGARQFPLGNPTVRDVDGRIVVRDEREKYVSAGTTGNREFLPRTVEVATYTHGYPRHVGVFAKLYPEIDWLGGLLLPQQGDLRLLGWRAEPHRLAARVANDGPGEARLLVRQVQFAGWRAWVDGRRVPIDVAPYVPEQQTAPGLMVVAVPPGEHTVSLAFGPSTLRLVSLGLTVAGALALPLALTWWTRAGRTRSERWVLVAVLALSAFAVLGCWRAARPAFGRFTVAAPVPEVRDGVWRAPHLAAGGAGLVVNLAEAVVAGRAQVASTSGAAIGPDKFVDVRQLTVSDEDPLRGAPGTSRREWLYMHPTAQVSVDVALPARPQVWFQAALALDPRVWSAEYGDGVRFQVMLQPLGAPDGAAPAAPATAVPQLLLDRVVNPRADQDVRRWTPVLVDLTPWAGRTVRLTLSTSQRGDLSFDWAGWGNPVVVVADTARDFVLK
ncbi:MAG: hypothetical protein AVDCRST_MAG77-2769 [uncultured Chloroflexi bacterium]|uniref:Membrane protein 6-pyruvoyl-tetrahydropterin synthase-related domain-containing protein n=1 Tax=uncultured Chloroflexota bacterium TaxID=166587 RepID=A0A6J4IWN0_9CHLR|nr:MAG: hypothetical protein AVDCRST_MAG77-2769 [uncultured Chloroflexota bacterium]